MEEIKIYRIVWKNIIAAIICLVFAVFGLVRIYQGDGNTLGLSGGMLFFGIGGVFLLYLTLKVRLHPYLTITNKNLIQSRVESGLSDWEIHFSEVDHFELSPFYILQPLKRDIRIYYKKDNHKLKTVSPNKLFRFFEKLNELSGIADDYIAIGGINMKHQQLFNLLNERIKNTK